MQQRQGGAAAGGGAFPGNAGNQFPLPGGGGGGGGRGYPGGMGAFSGYPGNANYPGMQAAMAGGNVRTHLPSSTRSAALRADAGRWRGAGLSRGDGDAG